MNNIMSKKMIVGWDEYKNTVEKLAILIHKEYNPTVLIGIMRGAAPIIDILSRILRYFLFLFKVLSLVFFKISKKFFADPSIIGTSSLFISIMTLSISET